MAASRIDILRTYTVGTYILQWVSDNNDAVSSCVVIASLINTVLVLVSSTCYDSVNASIILRECCYLWFELLPLYLILLRWLNKQYNFTCDHCCDYLDTLLSMVVEMNSNIKGVSLQSSVVTVRISNKFEFTYCSCYLLFVIKAVFIN